MAGYTNGGTAWETENERTPLSEPSATAQGGSGGGDLARHAVTEAKRLLFYAPADTVSVSYSEPAGYEGVNWEYHPLDQQDNHYSTTEPAAVADTEPGTLAQSGDDGGDLQAHFGGRFDRLGLYGNATENLSQFDSPAGYSGVNWDTSPGDGGEALLGVSVSGSFTDAQGSALSGTASIVLGDPEQQVTVEWYGETVTFGGVVASKSVTGPFTLSGLPPAGVVAGGDGAQSVAQMSALFEPGIAGVPSTLDLDEFRTTLPTTTYGEAYGRVEDAFGEPVAGVGVSSNGFGTNTGEDGRFKLLGPTGNSEQIKTLRGAVTDTIDFVEDADPNNPQVYAFAALTIQVFDATYSPIKQAAVTVDNETRQTDDAGEVSLSPMPPSTSYDITVMGEYEATVDLQEQGVDYVFQFGPDATAVDWEPDPSTNLSGVRLVAIDDVSGVRIRGIAATIDGTGIIETSGNNGVVKLVTTEVGKEDVTVLLGSGDKRYKPSQVEIEEMPEGDMVEADVYLRRKDQVVNT
jgi:hypothetical protein